MKLLYDFGIRLYGLIISIASLFNAKAKLWINGRKNLFQQLSSFDFRQNKWVWIHCASLGEFEQGRPIIEGLKRGSSCSIILTFYSPSGFEIRKNFKFADHICYMPLDTKFNAKKFIDIVNPEAAIIVKYEFWHNHILELKRKNIPILSVSSIFRPNQRFFKNNKYFASILQDIDYFYVQDKESRSLLKSINIDSVTISGDTRFDRVAEIPNKPKTIQPVKDFSANHNVIIGGSTWKKDEEILFQYLRKNPDWKLILAPHEVDYNNVQNIQNRLENAGLSYETMGEFKNINTQVLIIDCIGLLSQLYQFGTIAHVGGGFGSGIHNILEAFTWGIPVTFGPNHHKFKEAIDSITKGFGKSILNDNELKDQIELWDKAGFKSIGNSAREYINENTGATKLILDQINKILS